MSLAPSKKMKTFSIVLFAIFSLFVSGATFASDPFSPNRLVFNNLADPIVDSNGDGEIDILDALPTIPANTDAIVYVGADNQDQLFTLNAAGQPNIDFSNGAVNRIEDAVTLATELNVPLFTRGHFAVTDAIRITDSVSVSGYSAIPTVIHSLIDGGSVLFNIMSGSSDVVIENLTLNEEVDLSVAAVLLSGRNRNITINNIEFIGQRVGAIFHTTAAVYMFRDWVRDVSITNCSITDFQYGIHCVCGIRGLQILNNTFRRWNLFALRIARTAANDHLRTENIDVIGNDFRRPRPGLFRSVIFITRAESLLYILNVRVNRNTIVSDGGAFQFGDNTSNATGDQLVLHGVNGFQISDNSVFFGGENGITASTLSRNGIISRNVVHGNDTHGIIVGSGYYELSVSRASNFSVGDRILGVETRTQATVRNIRRHPGDGRVILGLDRVIGGRIFREEPITNLTTGMVKVDDAFIINRTKYIAVVDNIVFGNGRDQANDTPFTLSLIHISEPTRPY